MLTNLIRSAVLLATLFLIHTSDLFADQDARSADSGQQGEKPFLLALTLSGGGFRSAAFSYGVLEELAQLQYCLYKTSENKTSEKFVLTKLDYVGPGGAKIDCNENMPLYRKGNLLDDVDYLSAISGGAFAAAHYSLRGKELFIKEFPDVLNKNIQNLLYRNLTWPFNPYLFPLRLVVSALDVPWSLITSPLSLFDVPAPSLTGLLLLKRVSGIVNIDDAITIYDKEVFGGGVLHGQITFGEIPKGLREKLLIHATDLSNESIFTFDKETIECLMAKTKEEFDKGSNYEKFSLAAAVGASAAVPGMFQPYTFPIVSTAQNLPSDSNCSRINTLDGSNLNLVDGGIYENLGLEGLMPYIFRHKATHKDLKVIVLAINAAVESNFKGSGGLMEVLDQGFNVLMGQRTGLSLSLYKEIFDIFGIKVVELSFNDLWNSQDVRQLMRKEIRDQRNRLFSEYQFKEGPRLIIQFVVPGGRYATAGLQPGDEILKVNNHLVTTITEFEDAWRTVVNNQEDAVLPIPIEVSRKDSELTLYLPARSEDPLRTPDLSYMVQASQSEFHLMKDMGQLHTTFSLTINERDTLIRAGRKLIRDKVGQEGNHELLRIINSMLDREYTGDCNAGIDVIREYCWPQEWDQKMFQRPLRPRLTEIWRTVNKVFYPKVRNKTQISTP